MKLGQRRNSRARLVLVGAAALAALLALAFLSPEAGAQVPCPPPNLGADSDADGITDGEECDGIILPSGVSLFGGEASVPSCATASQPCLDPNKKTLFVILNPADPTHLPDTPLAFLPGLGIDVLRIVDTRAPSDRSLSVALGQKAGRCGEDLSDGLALAQSNWGTPNDLDECAVFTVRVEDDAADMYADCAAGTPDTVVVANYKRWVVNHEFGHLVGTRFEYDSALGGHHYRPRDAVVMSQSITYRCKSGGKISVNIPTTWAAPDPGDVAIAGSLAGP